MAYKRTQCVNSLCDKYKKGLCALIAKPRNPFEERCVIPRYSCKEFIPADDNGTYHSGVAKQERIKIKTKGVKL